MIQIKKKTVNKREYKVDINANIAIFVRLWKPRIELEYIVCQSDSSMQSKTWSDIVQWSSN